MYVLEYLVLCGTSLRGLASLDKIGEDIEVGKMSSNHNRVVRTDLYKFKTIIDDVDISVDL